MNITEVLEGVKKGRSYSRPDLKVGHRYSCKIVSINNAPYVWSRTNIPNVFGWDKLDNVDDLEPKHRNATDWIRVSPPAP